MRQVKALTGLSGLLTKDQIYTVLYETKTTITVADDRGIQCAYSAGRFEAIHTPKGSPDFSQMQHIADGVNNTLQPDESGIKCPVVESVNDLLMKNPLRAAHDRIAELEEQVRLLTEASNK